MKTHHFKETYEESEQHLQDAVERYAFCAYGNEYARMIDAQDERFVTYLDMLDAFESSVEKREKHLVKRANAHAEWISSCIDFACTEDINIELICEIGARMMHVDKDLLWY